jgi:hypothetical protein
MELVRTVSACYLFYWQPVGIDDVCHAMTGWLRRLACDAGACTAGAIAADTSSTTACSNEKPANAFASHARHATVFHPCLLLDQPKLLTICAICSRR